MRHRNRFQASARTEGRFPEIERDWEPCIIFGSKPVRFVPNPGPAMYKVGQIEELVNHILMFASRSALYNCLLVCKSYYYAAIPNLWEEIPSAWPLLHLLGGIERIEGIPGVSPKAWKFTSRPVNSNWELFADRAKYVKIISRPNPSWSRGTMDYHDPWMGREDTDEDETIDVCRDRSSIHPLALVQLMDNPAAASNGSFSKKALLPNLEHLEFTFSRFQAPPEAFVPLLGPNLKSLRLFYHLCSRMRVDREGVVGQQRLIRQGLQALAEYAGELSLEELEVSLECLLFLGGEYQDINNACIQVLRRFKYLHRLQTPPFARHEQLALALQSFSRPRSLAVAFERAQELFSFVTVFAPNHPNIEVLELEHRNDGPTPPAILIPLYQCRKLVNLFISVYFRGDLPPLGSWPLPDVHRMSEAWPHLETLTLLPLASIPLGDLAAFQNSGLFPKLKHLELPINSIGFSPPSLRLRLALRSLRSLQTFTIASDPNTSESDIPALIKFVWWAKPVFIIFHFAPMKMYGERTLRDGNECGEEKWTPAWTNGVTARENVFYFTPKGLVD